MHTRSLVQPAEPRQTARVHFADGRIYEAPIGTTLETYIQAIKFDLPAPVVAAHINGELRELTYHILTDSDVTPITIADSDGMRIYRRSLAFLMISVARKLFPDAQVVIDYALNFGGFYCEVRGRAPLTVKELARIEAGMRDLVDADIPIEKKRVPLEEALSYFETKGHVDKIRLLKTRTKDYLTLYTLKEAKDYYHGYMVPSTGYLQQFALRCYGPGFVLQYPRRELPTVIQEPVEYPKLVAVYNEYSEWMEVMGIPDVGALNEANEAGRMREVFLVSEALHEQRIARVASDIAEQHPQVRLVLIAHGIGPTTVALDDFLVNREETPRDESGDYDFESLHALDLPLFNDILLRLMDGHEVTLPRYNFITGLREKGETIHISQDNVMIVEGIHGMNPALARDIHPQRIYRVYVSALTQLNIDQHNRVSTTDTRLLRRIVRDATYRGYSASDTIKRWESVRRGEKRWIFPFQEHADVMFNSALVYELAVLKPFAEPLLLQVKPRTPEHIEAKRLLSFIDWFIAVAPDLIPDNSILREFIGGSILRDYVP